MTSKKVSEVSVIITCQDEDGGTELSSEEYDQLVKVPVLIHWSVGVILL